MNACVGDQIRIRGHRLGDPDRCGQIVETRGSGGTPPFVVRWDDSDHDVLFFPGSDAVVDAPDHSHDRESGSEHHANA
jgi:hypothetical protein